MENQSEDIYKAYRNKYYSRRTNIHNSKRTPNNNNQYNNLINQYNYAHNNQNANNLVDPNLNYSSIPAQSPQQVSSIGIPGPINQVAVPDDILRGMDHLMKQNESLHSEIEDYKTKILSLEHLIYVFYHKLIEVENIVNSQPPPNASNNRFLDKNKK